MIAIRKQFASSAHSLCRAQWTVVKLARAWSTMSDPIVTIKQGRLRGTVVDGALGSSYIAFHEIPFAAPPIGQLRFKDPQPPAPWTDIKDTSKYAGKVCTQIQENSPYDVIGDEDCLYLNVYTNSISECKPVMFWIHGGAFLVGTGSYEAKRPDYLLMKDVVVVSANYRLGALGFLNLGHRAAPGNLGLKDLIAALEWVRENIANFGGDPNNVTIFGASAGGALVHALTISPRAQGLFHKAIIQSGLLTCPWGFKQSLPERGFKLALFLGKESMDPEEVVEYLRSLDARDIVKAHSTILTTEEMRSCCLPFGINSDSFAENSVLPSPMEELLSKDANIPVMVGYTSHEYLMFIKDTCAETMKSHNDNLPLYVKVLAALKRLGPTETEELLKTVKDSYFCGQSITKDTVLELIRFLSDLNFGIPAILYAEDRVKRTSSPSYFYRYSYAGTEETYTDFLVQRVATGASHVDELTYLFYMPNFKIKNRNPPAECTPDRVVLERMTRMWTNFAKTGNPTPCHDDFIKTTWEPVTKDQLKYLEIGEESEMLIMPPHVLSTK